MVILSAVSHEIEVRFECLLFPSIDHVAQAVSVKTQLRRQLSLPRHRGRFLIFKPYNIPDLLPLTQLPNAMPRNSHAAKYGELKVSALISPARIFHLEKETPTRGFISQRLSTHMSEG